MSNSDKYSDLADQMVKQYGPILGGTELRNVLGFKAASTFNRAKRLNLIGVHIFQLPNRRGSYALTADVADWLNRMSKQ